MPRNSIKVLIVYQAQPGRASDGLSALSTLVATVVAEEPACLGITIHQDVADPTRILLDEEWTDQASYLSLIHISEPTRPY